MKRTASAPDTDGPAARTGLVDAANTVAAGAAGVEHLYRAFRPATVYCERATRPGFRALGRPGDGMVPVFTSPAQLALARGPVGWFSLRGTDLLDLLPVGYDILLDLAGASPLLLRPGRIGRRAVFRPVLGGG